MNNNELYHFGILGMKWGVHRRTSEKESSTKKSKPGSKLIKSGAGIFGATVAVATIPYAAIRIGIKINNDTLVSKGLSAYDEMSPLSIASGIASVTGLGLMTAGAIKKVSNNISNKESKG